MFNLGFGEILIICAVLIIVVGPDRLPSLMKTVGKTIRTVRQASREIQTTVGLDELLREDITRPLPPPKPRLAPSATVSRDAAVTPPVEPASSATAPVVIAAESQPGATVPDATVAAVPGAVPPQNVPPQLFVASDDPHSSPSPKPTTPSLAEADGVSVSERMLQLHTPPEPPAPSAKPDSTQALGESGTGVGSSGGGKGDA